MRTLLVADDQRALRRLVRMALTTDSLQLVEDGDGYEAWEHAGQTEPYRPVRLVCLVDDLLGS